MKDKGILTIMLCTVVVIMAVAYAAFSTTLTINGTASISSTWEVGFEQESSSCSDGSVVSVTGTLATLAVELESPGDSVTCTLTVKNTGTLDAKLESIVVTPSGNAPITFTTSPAVGADLSTDRFWLKQMEQKQLQLLLHIMLMLSLNQRVFKIQF